MQPRFLLFSLPLLLAFLSACTEAIHKKAIPSSSFNQLIASAPTKSEVYGIKFQKIAEGVWTHRAYKTFEKWGPFPTTGLIIAREDKIILIDSAWDDTQTNVILDWVETNFGRPVTAAIFTHAHSDKMGGVGAIRQRHIPTFAFTLSNKIAPEKALVPAQYNLRFRTDGKWLPSNGVTANYFKGLDIFYPGPGHSDDNIVVGISGTPVLFGGCLIRPADTSNLGSTKDADITNWANAVRKLSAHFTDAEVIVPSHGPKGDRALLATTIELAEAANRD